MDAITLIGMLLVGFSRGIEYARKNPDEDHLRRVEKLLLPIMGIVAAALFGNLISQLR